MTKKKELRKDLMADITKYFWHPLFFYSFSLFSPSDLFWQCTLFTQCDDAFPPLFTLEI